MTKFWKKEKHFEIWGILHVHEICLENVDLKSDTWSVRKIFAKKEYQMKYFHKITRQTF